MCRIYLYVVLALSLLLPLQVAASSLLSAKTCPMEAAAHASGFSMGHDCCDDANDSHCDKMPDCQGCEFVSSPVFAPENSSFSICYNSAAVLVVAAPPLYPFDPSAVWRPPINS